MMEHNWKREKKDVIFFLSRMLLYLQTMMEESDELENEENKVLTLTTQTA